MFRAIPETSRMSQQYSGTALSRAVSKGGVSRSGLVLPCLSFFSFFGDFPVFSGIFSISWGAFPYLSFPLSRPIHSGKETYEEQPRKGPRHNSDLSRKKVGNPPVWKLSTPVAKTWRSCVCVWKATLALKLNLCTGTGWRACFHIFFTPPGPYDFPGKISTIIRTGDCFARIMFRGTRYWYANFASLAGNMDSPT